MDPMLAAFLSESRENLEAAGHCFLQLEKSPNDEGILNDLFRSIHTIKGASGLFEIMPLTRVVHAAEDLLDTIRSGELELSAELVDLFLDCMDKINIWLDNLEESAVLPEGAETISQKMTEILRGYLGEQENTEKSQSSDTLEVTANTAIETAPEWIKHIPDDLRRESYLEHEDADKQLMSIAYKPEEGCFFSGDDPIYTVLMLPGLVWFELEENEPWPKAEHIDPFHCNVTFNILLVASEEEIRYQLRYVDEQIDLRVLAFDELIFPAGGNGDSELFSMLNDDAKNTLEHYDWTKLAALIKPVLTMNSHELIQCSALLWIQALLKQKNPSVQLITALLNTAITGEFVTPVDSFIHKNSADKGGNLSKSLEKNETCDGLIQLQLEILGLPCEPELLNGRIHSVNTVLMRLFEQKGWETQLSELKTVTEQSLEEDSPAQLCRFLSRHTSTNRKPETKQKSLTANVEKSRVPDDEIAKGYPARTKAKVLKVDQARIDSLMDLVGELVVAKNALPFLAKRAEEEFSVRPLAKEIKAQYSVINRLSEELQSAMMQVRMVSISSVFQRFPRLVRDLSRKLNKQIELVVEGEDTEADKNIVEDLPDPLIHIVRNSLDHGLETVEERIAAGKNPTGKIILRATQLDDQVQIDIIDDGKGINVEVIKQKSYEKGVITEEQLETISDKEVLQLIFAPGLSTAEEVSDLSGRGVGMDVVKTVISKAGGSIDVSSESGQGTSIRLRMPLSMAISRVMMVEVCGQSYGVSMDVINETVRVKRDEIKKIKHDEVITLRDKVVPLIRMRSLLGLTESDCNGQEEEAVLVVTMGKELVGLVIDEFHEGIDIILKPLEGVMKTSKEYTGTALLGDGRVLLVLNLKELLK